MSNQEFTKLAIPYLKQLASLLLSGETFDFGNEFDLEDGKELEQLINEFDTASTQI